MTDAILLVDDDAATRELLSDFLTREGYVVHTAANGREALDLLAGITPQLILLDYMMPVMTGNQFLAARRRDARLRRIPVVILSAWTRQWVGTRLRVADVLTKPVDLERLLRVVRRLCGTTVPDRRGAIERRRRSRPSGAAWTRSDVISVSSSRTIPNDL